MSPVPTDISAHSLRRTWENLLREAGVEQLVRRSMAGWRSEKAQAIYATVNRYPLHGPHLPPVIQAAQNGVYGRY